MTKLTEEERQRLCVAKFRDMSDHMLSEMPGTVMELAEKYVRIRDKFTKTSKFLLDTLPHAPSENAASNLTPTEREFFLSGFTESEQCEECGNIIAECWCDDFDSIENNQESNDD